MEQRPPRDIAPSLLPFAILYGGMVPLGGFPGAKQVAIGRRLDDRHDAGAAA